LISETETCFTKPLKPTQETVSPVKLEGNCTVVDDDLYLVTAAEITTKL